MPFNYYPEYYKPITQAGSITNYTWSVSGAEVYDTKPAAVAAAEAAGLTGSYEVRIIKSSWEIVETIPLI